MNEIESLLQELREKLPAHEIIIRDNHIIFYDFYGVTFREDQSEAEFADLYIMRVAEEKLGYAIRIVEWSPSNNGHFAHRFERKYPE